MRILLTADPDLPVPPRFYGGIERIIDTLIIELQSRGHTIGLCAHRDSTTPVDRLFPWNGVRSQNKLDILKNTATLYTAVQQFQPDLIHSFSRIFYLSLFFRSSIPKLMSYQRAPTQSTTHWGAKLSNGSLTFTGCSEYICRQGVPAGGSWHAIHNYVDLDKFTFQPKVSEDAPLVFLSRIEWIKGTHTAIAIARQTGRRLIIAGNHGETGEEGRYWYKEIVPHLGKDGVEYVGAVDDVQKNHLLGQAAAMMVPIEWDEPFGIVFAEALACGTPVISCPRGALPEIVRQGIDGYLVNSLEDGCTAIENLDKLDRHNCRQRVEEFFSVDVIVNQYEQLYQQLLLSKTVKK